MLAGALVGDSAGVKKRTVLGQFVVTLVPALFISFVLAWVYSGATAPASETSTAGLVLAGAAGSQEFKESEIQGGLAEFPAEQDEPKEAGAGTLAAPPTDAPNEPGAAPTGAGQPGKASAPPRAGRAPAPTWFWIVLGIGACVLMLVYWLWNWERLEVFKMLLSSFFPLALLILAVLGSIVFGLATPAEAAAVGAFGGFIMVMVYRYISLRREAGPGQGVAVLGRTARDFYGIVRESSFLTAKTSAMVCWLFVGSGIFSAAFALLGGQEVIEKWVLSLDMTPLQFMILAQFIIFLLGWPLEWTEIIVIFMPIFIPLLPHFGIDPLFFGLLVALNLQTAFLSPPVAMAAFYLKGVSPPHVTLNQIFAGMMPFMGIQIIALVLLYTFPDIGLWLPRAIYK